MNLRCSSQSILNICSSREKEGNRDIFIQYIKNNKHSSDMGGEFAKENKAMNTHLVLWDRWRR